LLQTQNKDVIQDSFNFYYIIDLRHSHSLSVCWTFVVKSVVTLVIE